MQDFQKWLRDNGEALRYQYDLDENSVIIDLGGFKGEWSENIIKLFNPYIHIFEPINEFYDICYEKFKDNPKVTLHKLAVEGYAGDGQIVYEDNGSSMYIAGNQTYDCKTIKLSTYIKDNNITSIDLIKSNIEGSEYNVVEDLLDSGLINIVKNYQIQWHMIPVLADKIQELRDRLTNTHNLDWFYAWVWESWKRK